MQNAFVESFNGRLRDECLNTCSPTPTSKRHHRNLGGDYNATRYTSLHGFTPPEFAA
jgi:putative transposase